MLVLLATFAFAFAFAFEFVVCRNPFWTNGPKTGIFFKGEDFRSFPTFKIAYDFVAKSTFDPTPGARNNHRAPAASAELGVCSGNSASVSIGPHLQNHAQGWRACGRRPGYRTQSNPDGSRDP